MTTLAQQITAAERELGLRRRVYPRWVIAGKLTPEKANAETEAMAAIVETLKVLAMAARDHDSMRSRIPGATTVPQASQGELDMRERNDE